jgi:hypothetical protein
MAFEKGKSGNPGGHAAVLRAKQARLDILAHKVLRLWERVLSDDLDATVQEKLQVARDVVSYAWGKPKQQITVDATLEVNHRAHIDALTQLANAAIGPTLDLNPLEYQDKSGGRPKPDILVGHNPSDGATQHSDGAAQQVQPAAGEDPPPDSRGSPGGALVDEQAVPLDKKS